MILNPTSAGKVLDVIVSGYMDEAGRFEGIDELAAASRTRRLSLVIEQSRVELVADDRRARGRRRRRLGWCRGHGCILLHLGGEAPAAEVQPALDRALRTA